MFQLAFSLHSHGISIIYSFPTPTSGERVRVLQILLVWWIEKLNYTAAWKREKIELKSKEKYIKRKRKQKKKSLFAQKRNSGGGEITKVWKISQANVGRFLACGREKRKVWMIPAFISFSCEARFMNYWSLSISIRRSGWEIYTINATFAESAECRTNTREKVKLNSGIKATFPPTSTHSWEAFASGMIVTLSQPERQDHQNLISF